MAEVDLSRLGRFSLDDLCEAILEKHQDTIRTQKAHVAVVKLSKIIETILKLSNKQGFHATSLREISRCSGVSMGGLYSYFDSKDTLLMMILGQVSSSVMRVLNGAPPDLKESPLDHLRWLIHAHVQLTEVMLPWFVFAFMEAKSFPSAGRKLAIESEQATERILAAVLEKGAHAGVFSVSRPDFAAALIKPMLQDWYVKRSKWRRRGVSASAYAGELCTFIEAALNVHAAS